MAEPWLLAVILFGILFLPFLPFVIWVTAVLTVRLIKGRKFAAAYFLGVDLSYDKENPDD